eukprot:scaffold427489_cov18-Prasinocladus_malaysianus.AAC.1
MLSQATKQSNPCGDANTEISYFAKIPPLTPDLFTPKTCAKLSLHYLLCTGKQRSKSSGHYWLNANLAALSIATGYYLLHALMR